MSEARKIGWCFLVLAGCGGEVREAAIMPARAETASESAPAPTPSDAVDAGAEDAEHPRCWPSGIASGGGCFTCPAPEVQGGVRPLRRRPSAAVSAVPAVQSPAGPSSRLTGPVNTSIANAKQQKALVQSLPLAHPSRARELRKLADAYIELEDGAAIERARAEAARDAAREAGQKGVEASEEANRSAAAKLEELSRNEAIAALRTLAEDYAGQPSQRFPTAPPAPLADLDDVLDLLLIEHQSAGDGASARRVGMNLITHFPSSKHVPHAYLVFADYFFDEAQSDPSKLPMAQQAYEKVIAAPPPLNRFYGYAWYKLAYVHYTQNDFQHALAAFVKVIEYGAQYPSLAGAANLAAAAKKDIVPVYATAGDPKGAFAFFQRAVTDPAEALALYAAVADAYRGTGHYAEALVVYRDLLVRSGESEETRCAYHNRVRELLYTLGHRDACAECAP